VSGVSGQEEPVLHLDVSTLQRPVLAPGCVLTPQGTELHLAMSGQQEPVLLLSMSKPQGPELHLDVSTLQLPILHLNVFTPQGPELFLYLPGQ
jgi:hypothetical protein